ASGCEVIHLGHNRSVEEIVDTALQEDAHGIAISSYQGGHVEYFKYMIDLLRERGAGHVKVFGGGGGVIVPSEIRELHEYGVARIFSPEDGQKLGLQGMINEIVAACDVDLATDLPASLDALASSDRFERTRTLARLISGLEAGVVPAKTRDAILAAAAKSTAPVLGVTGTGGAGKSSLTDELIRRLRLDQDDRLQVAVISIDPSRRKSGGALLGDRIRMNAIGTVAGRAPVYMRSLATREAGSEISKALPDVIAACRAAAFDLVIVETSGIGQGDAAIVPHADVSLYVMTPEFGAASQLEKIDMLDFADFVAINKFDRKGAADALRDVRKQYQRNRERFKEAPDRMPVFGTMASRFNDDGVTALWQAIAPALAAKGLKLGAPKLPPVEVRQSSGQNTIVPPARARYLAEIAETCRDYRTWAEAQARLARERQQLRASRAMLEETKRWKEPLAKSGHVSDTEAAEQIHSLVRNAEHTIDALIEERERALDGRAKKLIEMWPRTKASYAGDEYVVKIRDREIRTALNHTSLSGTKIPKVALPRWEDEGEILRWQLLENVPGSFPFTAGVFAFKRENEDPTRMFALYGHDPDRRPDIYGKVGNSGVSIATLDDIKVLYSGFDLCAPATSVSMTINGPAPTILAMFLNAAIDQQITKFRHDNEREPTDDEAAKIRAWTLSTVRGTVQADILKEDQGQNTCIFSTEFSLKVMGDIQDYFVHHDVR
ncbi:MAG: methylmalonyl-CoA mutase, partial [Betaproteobacteria bacterium PRO3]|nr:methylmalonyl-CoA mutase [Betaproteobacteria bacterium PRO3]